MENRNTGNTRRTASQGRSTAQNRNASRAGARDREIAARQTTRQPMQKNTSRAPRRRKKPVNWFRVTVFAVAAAVVILILLAAVKGLQGAAGSGAAGGSSATAQGSDPEFFSTIRPDGADSGDGAGATPGATSSAPPQSTLSGTLFVGDSLTAQLASYAESTTGTLKDAKFVTADNAAWSSAASGDKDFTQNGESVSLSDLIKNSGAATVYIQLGMNDLINGDTSTAVENAKKAIDAIAALENPPKITVQGITPMVSGISYLGLGNESITAYNDAMKSYCAESKKASFADIGAAFGTAGLDIAYCADPNQLCIHLNAEGCALWEDYLQNGAAATLTPSPTPSPTPDTAAGDDADATA